MQFFTLFQARAASENDISKLVPVQVLPAGWPSVAGLSESSSTNPFSTIRYLTYNHLLPTTVACLSHMVTTEPSLWHPDSIHWRKPSGEEEASSTMDVNLWDACLKTQTHQTWTICLLRYHWSWLRKYVLFCLGEMTFYQIPYGFLGHFCLIVAFKNDKI